MNGYKNYATWNIASWISNSDSVNDLIIQLATEAKKKSASPRDTLGEQIKNYVEEHAPALDAGMYKDLLAWAIQEADYNEIADTYLKQ